MTDDRQASGAGSEEPISAAPVHSSSQPQKILCVDDREQNLFALEQVLASTGALIHKARSGNEALTASLNQHFALAILDVRMPGMDGYEVAEFLRQEEQTKHLPIIFVSAVLSDDHQVFRGYQAGAVDFLTKPFKPEVLLNKVNFFLELDRQRQLLVDKVRLEEAKNHLEAVLMSLTDAVFVLSERAIISTVNRAAVELCECEESELIGKPISELFPDLSLGALTPTAGEAQRPSIGADFERREYTLTATSGRELVVLLSASRLRTPAGEVTGTVLVALDLASKQEAEKERSQLVTAIQQSTDGVVLLDKQGRITYVNPAFGDLVGAPAEKIVGLEFESFEDGEGSDLSAGQRRQELEGGRSWRGQSRIRGLHGVAYDTEQSVSPIRNDKGEATSFVALIRDVSILRELELQLRQAQKMEAIGALARGIAHDFNNMLTPILGYTELSLGALAPDHSVCRFLNEVRSAAMRATQLVQQILVFGLQTEQDSKPMALQSVINEACALLRGSLPSTIEITLDVDQDCDPILADPTQIHQVIMNLATNAYHAMEERGGQLFIGLRESQAEPTQTHGGLTIEAGDYAVMTIRDSGCGIPQHILANIFDPFFTTKAKGKGSGLGLATVHGIVKSFRGALRVKSVLDIGTQFDILLPLCRLNQTRSHQHHTTATLPTGNERILLVDDEAPVAELEAEGLALLGYQVTTCTDSETALMTYQQSAQSYDLVITDLTMPHMTGIELATEILARRPDLPVILCTGFADQVTREATMAVGIRAMLYKPILQRELAETVRRVLDERPLPRAPDHP